MVNEANTKCLGVLLMVRYKNRRASYLLDFEPTREADKQTTITLLKQILSRVNLCDSLEKGRLPIVADAQLRNVVQEIKGF